MIEQSLQDAREEVALAHRLATHHGLNEGVWNHISFVSPTQDGSILISPGHTHWSQITASSLALMDNDGQLIAGQRPPIRAGWIIHKPIHDARPDAKCVIHIHGPYTTAMSIRSDMLFETRSSQQAAMLHDDVAYFDEYDGVLDGLEEGQRMAAALGDKRVLFLRNHGVVVVGRSVSAAYLDLYQLERACMYQILACSGGGKMQLIPEGVAAEISERAKDGLFAEHFEGMRRWINEIDRDYAQ
jgi:ribulose-5-phosphate 4-epimerase/fuculose-1-phosphate aldolase